MTYTIRKQIGEIGVDAGLCWIGDPCYILHKEHPPKAIGTSWDEFCDILLLPVLQGEPKGRGAAHLVIACHPGVQQQRPRVVEHLQGQFMARAEHNVLGDARLLPALLVLRPGLGQVQTQVDQGMLHAGNITQVDADLAILDLAQTSAPLPLNAHGLGPALGEGRRIEHQHAIGFPHFRSDLPGQLLEQGSMFPKNLSHKLLQPLTVLVVMVGDRFSILAFHVRQ
jgi:hypothetical protein